MANRYFRTAKIKINAGITNIKPPANLRCSGDVSRFCNKKAVNVRFSTVKTAAAKTSFQEITKAKIAEAAMPGKINGNTTLVKPVRRLQPNVQATSSSSMGTPEKIEKVINTAKGSANVVCTSAKPNIVSSNPVRMNKTAKGSAKRGRGKARVKRINSRNVDFPRKSKRDKAYPAGAPITIDMIIVITATLIELLRADVMPANWEKKIKLSKSNSGTKFLGKEFTAFDDDNAFTKSR